MKTQIIPNEDVSNELFVIQTEERLETVQVAAEAAYTSCMADIDAA